MEIKKIGSANGIITVPGDKSISHRSVMLGALANGVTRVRGFLKGEDCLATIDCFRSMGVNIEEDSSCLTIFGKGLHGLTKPQNTLYTANSGTTTRLLLGILAGQDFDCRITGDASIGKRPMKRVTKPLSLMGARIEGEYCPLSVHGSPLHGIEYEMPVASAQVKTALLLAGLYAEGETLIHEKQKSRDHTELMLSAMGADIDIIGLSVRINQGSELMPFDISVPGDISSAAFFMVLGAVSPNSQITIKNVGINPTRTGIIDVLKAMGADIRLENVCINAGEIAADITVSSSSLKGTVIGGSIIPRLIDELPIIAAAALFADGKTVIKDAAELKVKESNRIDAVYNEFIKCGADIEKTDDGLIINGGASLHGADFKTYGDHRMAMTLSVLARLIDGKSSLDDAECVNISYPTFFDDLYGLG